MNKMFLVVISICLIFCFPVYAGAETAETAFEMTGIIEALIALFAAVGLAILRYVWKKYIRDWLVQNELMEVAEIVVNAVEAIVGRGKGEEKWAMALEKMANEYGFDVNSEAVQDALRAAWKQLDLSQLMAGEKTPKIEGGDSDA